MKKDQNLQAATCPINDEYSENTEIKSSTCNKFMECRFWQMSFVLNLCTQSVGYYAL